MKNVEYKNMVDGIAKNGAAYIEAPVGALNIGDVVTKTVLPSPRALQRSRGTPKITIETYKITGFGGEFYSAILGCDVARAYCEKNIEYKEYVA
jgi:hypothetical protein